MSNPALPDRGGCGEGKLVDCQGEESSQDQALVFGGQVESQAGVWRNCFASRAVAGNNRWLVRQRDANGCTVYEGPKLKTSRNGDDADCRPSLVRIPIFAAAGGEKPLTSPWSCKRSSRCGMSLDLPPRMEFGRKRVGLVVRRTPKDGGKVELVENVVVSTVALEVWCNGIA
ncbi:hypothetical protein CIRG_05953 [Coccidioides immitis RMSCC 2394]|uniref:Uncharacterized protein n=1 Tax=Coccidioides immitis RMSCC 2394 TaxID=404692 RepID=A0A0J6YBZ6_COCIT|nr:hypothetical protein CIRG_05953 [Coccidioides immitis RMSCC 2394]